MGWGGGVGYEVELPKAALQNATPVWCLSYVEQLKSHTWLFGSNSEIFPFGVFHVFEPGKIYLNFLVISARMNVYMTSQRCKVNKMGGNN